MLGRKFAHVSRRADAGPTGPFAEAQRLEALGDVHAASENLVLALEYFARALTDLRQRPAEVHPLDVSRVLRKIAACDERRGDLHAAGDALAEARRLLFGGGPACRVERAVLFGRSSILETLRGRYARARRLATTSLSILRLTSEHSEVAQVESRLGAVEQREGRLERARENYESALANFRRVGDDAGVARMLNNVANILRTEGSFREAIGYYQKAARLNEEAGNLAQLAGNCLNLVMPHIFLAQWAQAEATLARGRRLAEQTGNVPQTVRSLLAEAMLARRRNEFARGLASLDRAESLALSAQLARESVLVIEFRGDIEFARGAPAVARELYHAARERARVLAEDGDIVLELERRLADVALAEGDIETARNAALAAASMARLQADRLEEAAAERALGLVASRTGHWPDAVSHFDVALGTFEAIGERWELTQSFVVFAQEALSGTPDTSRVEQARGWLRRAEALASEIEDAPLSTHAGLGLAQVELHRSRLDAVFHHLDSLAPSLAAVPDELRGDLSRRVAELRAAAESRAEGASSALPASGRLIEHVHALMRDASNPVEALNQVLRLLAETIGADRVFVARRTAGQARVLAHIGLRREHAEHTFAALESAGLLEGDRTVVSTSVPADPRLIGESSAFRGVRSFIQCPLGLSAPAAGWLYVDRLETAGQGPFLQGDVTAASVLASLATVAVLESERASLERDYAHLRAKLNQTSTFEAVITQNVKMLDVLRQVEKVGASPERVLIQGETGSGKGLIARCIHESSRRSARSFIQLNCAALTETLLESELFGHERGSFTGAIRDKKGLFEEASDGTLFLDEIDKTSLGTQGKLLHVLEMAQVRPVGSNHWRPVDTRVITATNARLATSIQERRFLEDLYYRLNDIVIALPSLRERRDDVPLLAHHFLDRFRVSIEKDVRGFSDAVMARLVAYDWPGNVRELEKAVRRMIVLAEPGAVIELDLLPPAILGDAVGEMTTGKTLRDQVERVERRVIADTLRACGWNRSETARQLHISYPCLLSKIRTFGLTPHSC